jgi:hypothetical protein
LAILLTNTPSCRTNTTFPSRNTTFPGNQENVPKETTSSTLLQIKKNNIIQYKLPDSEERISATVLGKAGKMTGKNKTWYNVQDHLSNEQKSVDLGRLEW